MCLCVFTKLHITAQSGLVTLFKSMPLALLLPRGVIIKGSIILIRKPLIRCDKGDTLSLQFLLKP